MIPNTLIQSLEQTIGFSVFECNERAIIRKADRAVLPDYCCVIHPCFESQKKLGNRCRVQYCVQDGPS